MKMLFGLVIAVGVTTAAVAVPTATCIYGVVRQDSKPAPGVTVIATNRATGASNKGRTDKSGRFAIEVPGSGKEYIVTVDADVDRQAQSLSVGVNGIETCPTLKDQTERGGNRQKPQSVH